ncbi:MAG: hypothetical protein F6J93_27890 [Oscillatoria sp. SIO1A7]|nr:hypothetical protein [Oscillatoria sp. SIO1A7]
MGCGAAIGVGCRLVWGVGCGVWGVGCGEREMRERGRIGEENVLEYSAPYSHTLHPTPYTLHQPTPYTLHPN